MSRACLGRSSCSADLTRRRRQYSDRPTCGRIIELLGALAGGYTWALRNRVFDQQEEIKRALSLAWQDLERDLRVRRLDSARCSTPPR